jgi:hypothetical protein
LFNEATAQCAFGRGELDKMLYIEKWMALFLEQYRFEALKLGPKDKECLAPYVKEQLLSPPCEVEALIFRNPFCLLFLFFFGPHVHDRRVSLHNSSWTRVHFLIGKFHMKYGTSNIDFEKFETMIGRIHQNVSQNSPNQQKPICGIDFIPKVCCIYFCQDLRIEAWPWNSKSRSESSDIANTVFHLNYCQAIDEATGGQILRVAVKELEKRGFREVDEQGI